MRGYIKYIMIGMIVWNVCISAILFFTYSPEYDTPSYLLKEYLVKNIEYLLIMFFNYVLYKLYLKAQKK